MAKINPDDLILVNRDGVDYQASVDDLPKQEFPPQVTPSIDEVLSEGNNASPGQALKFKVKTGDIPPFKRDIEVEASSGLRIGGLVSQYTIKEPFTIDDAGDVTEFAYCSRRITAVDDYYVAQHPKGGYVSASFGLQGIGYDTESTGFNVEDRYIRIACGEYGSENFKIVANTDSSTVTATEFIGDGSKLTGISGGDLTLEDVVENQGPALSNPIEDANVLWTGSSQQMWISKQKNSVAVMGNAITITDMDTGMGGSWMTDHFHIYSSSGNKSFSIDAATGEVNATKFIGDGSQLTGVGGGAKFIDVNEQAPADLNPGDIYIQQSGEEPWGEVCQGECHSAWQKCLEDGGSDYECYTPYVECLMACDDDFFTREKAERVARNRIERAKRDATGNIADDSFTGIAGEFIADGSYIFVDEDGQWQKAPAAEVNLDEYARLDGAAFTGSVTAPEFIGDGSKLTNLPGGAVGIDEVLREGSTADAGQRLKFKITESDAPPYELPSTADVIDLDGRFASRHGAMASFYQVNEPLYIDTDTWNGTYQRAVGYVSAVGTSFNGLYESGGGKEFYVWADFGMAGAHLSITPQEGGYEDEVSLNIGVSGLDFRSPDLKIQNGSVTATEFVGDGSKLTGLPTPETPTLSDVVTAQGNPDGNKVNGSICLDGSNYRWFKVSSSSSVSKLLNNTLEIDGNIGMSKSGKVLIRTGDSQYFPSGGSTATVSIDHEKGTITVQGGESGFVGDGSRLTNLPVGDSYTKAESDAKYLPLDLRTLPELS